MSALNNIQAVLFDLDGTLIDTAPDFVRIIKEMCTEVGVTAPSDEIIRVQVSEGARAMVRTLYPDLSDESPELLSYRDEFLRRYEKDVAVHSTLFDGMDEVLRALEAQNIPWGIVTNKYRSFSVALLAALGLTDRCAVLVCPDDVVKPKPDPEPMFLAAQIIGVSPEHIVYVGDHPRDIDAGRAAGMRTVLAAYGYLPPDRAEDLASWHADYIVHHASELQTLWADRLQPVLATS
jgi:phosphoglycolate phosphatase